MRHNTNKSILLIYILLVLSSCSNKKEDIDSTAFYNVASIETTKQAKFISKIKIDTISIQGEIETSFVGDFSIYNDTLYFSDHFFGYLFRFNNKGGLIDRNIGKGNGPNEIRGGNYSIVSDNGYYFLDGGSSNLYFFNKNFKKEKDFRINWENKRSKQEVLANPIPTLGDSYEFGFGYPGIFKPWDKDHVAIAITASHPKFNGYFDTDLYYNHSRILAIVNMQSGKIEKYIGRRSPVYLKYKNLPNFDHFNYEVTEYQVFINFWADPIIYILDKSEGKAIGKFGQKGKNMKIDYPVTKTYEDAEDKWKEDQENYGHYHYMKYIPNQKMLFRGYHKGKGAITDGLQIYKENSLIGDIEIPKGLEIIGSMGNEFYAANKGINNEEVLRIYKIHLVYGK
jgi:hypothetical protein